MKPKVSIVLPTYNQAEYLPEAIDSILAQTYQDYELVIVNDGSTDHTAQVLSNYINRENFCVINQENKGLPIALNTGFRQTQGEYLTWTSSDNIFLPSTLEVLVRNLEKYPDVGLVYSDRYLIDETGNDLLRLNTPEYNPFLIMHANLVQCCFLYRRECYQKVGDYDDDFRYCEDWQYWIRISLHFHMKHIPEALYRYRFHPKSMTTDLLKDEKNRIIYKKLSDYLRKNYPFRWYVGKLLWRWIKVTNKNHPSLLETGARQKITSPNSIAA